MGGRRKHVPVLSKVSTTPAAPAPVPEVQAVRQAAGEEPVQARMQFTAEPVCPAGDGQVSTALEDMCPSSVCRSEGPGPSKGLKDLRASSPDGLDQPRLGVVHDQQAEPYRLRTLKGVPGVRQVLGEATGPNQAQGQVKPRGKPAPGTVMQIGVKANSVSRRYNG